MPEENSDREGEGERERERELKPPAACCLPVLVFGCCVSVTNAVITSQRRESRTKKGFGVCLFGRVSSALCRLFSNDAAAVAGAAAAAAATAIAFRVLRFLVRI